MEPGVYDDLPGAAYFEATDWVSSSKLKHHLPEYFKPSTGARDALDFGTAFHTTVLGVGDPIRPVPWLTWKGKEAQTLRADAYVAGETPILEKDLPTIDAMAKEVLSHPVAGPLLSGDGRNELSVFAEVDGVNCKARFDRVKGSAGLDLKTTAAMPSEYALVRAVVDYGYDVSADHYLRVASAAGLDVDTFTLIFCGKEPPHFVTVVELDQSFFDRADVLRRLALDRMLHPEMVEPYPGAEGRLTVTLPRWAQIGP